MRRAALNSRNEISLFGSALRLQAPHQGRLLVRAETDGCVSGNRMYAPVRHCTAAFADGESDGDFDVVPLRRPGS